MQSLLQGPLGDMLEAQACGFTVSVPFQNPALSRTRGSVGHRPAHGVRLTLESLVSQWSSPPAQSQTAVSCDALQLQPVRCATTKTSPACWPRGRCRAPLVQALAAALSVYTTCHYRYLHPNK